MPPVDGDAQIEDDLDDDIDADPHPMDEDAVPLNVQPNIPPDINQNIDINPIPPTDPQEDETKEFENDCDPQTDEIFTETPPLTPCAIHPRWIRRKQTIYHEDDYPLFLDFEDVKETEHRNENEDDDHDVDSNASSTLSELEARLKVLEQRIAHKKGIHNVEDGNDDVIPAANPNPLLAPNEPVEDAHAVPDEIHPDALHPEDPVQHHPAPPPNANHMEEDRFPDNLEGDIAFILDCIGMNDEYEVMVQNHFICLYEMVLVHCAVLLLPHCLGHVTIQCVYAVLYTVGMVDYHDYHGQSRYGPFTRNFMALYIGYVSCYWFQKALSFVLQYGFQSV